MYRMVETSDRPIVVHVGPGWGTVAADSDENCAYRPM